MQGSEAASNLEGSSIEEKARSHTGAGVQPSTMEALGRHLQTESDGSDLEDGHEDDDDVDSEKRRERR